MKRANKGQFMIAVHKILNPLFHLHGCFIGKSKCNNGRRECMLQQYQMRNARGDYARFS